MESRIVGQAGQGNQQGSQESKARPGQRRISLWTRDYARLPGIPDEYIGPDGAPRPAWSRFLDAFAALSPGEIERRFASADRHLREAGVTYRAPGEAADRLWPSSLPLGCGGRNFTPAYPHLSALLRGHPPRLWWTRKVTE